MIFSRNIVDISPKIIYQRHYIYKIFFLFNDNGDEHGIYHVCRDYGRSVRPVIE